MQEFDNKILEGLLSSQDAIKDKTGEQPKRNEPKISSETPEISDETRKLSKDENVQDRYQCLSELHSENETSKSKNLGYLRHYNVENDRNNYQDFMKPFINVNMDNEASQHLAKVDNLCKLLPIVTLDNLNEGLGPSNTRIGRKKSSQISTTSLENFEDEVLANLLNIEEETNNKEGSQQLMNKPLSNIKRSKDVKSSKEQRKKSSRKKHKQEYPILPQLLSLGVYDNINSSVEDTRDNKRSSKLVVKYHEGSLIYEKNGRPIENPKCDKDSIRNSQTPTMYESGKYDEYLTRVEEVAKENSHVHKLGFSNMQYAIRKELDRTLQTDAVKDSNEKFRQNSKISAPTTLGQTVGNYEESSMVAGKDEFIASQQNVNIPRVSENRIQKAKVENVSEEVSGIVRNKEIPSDEIEKEEKEIDVAESDYSIQGSSKKMLDETDRGVNTKKLIPQNQIDANSADKNIQSESIDQFEKRIEKELNSDNTNSNPNDNKFCQSLENKDNSLEIGTTDKSKNCAEVHVAAKTDVLSCDTKSELINSDDIMTVNEVSNNKLPISNCHDFSNANELGIIRIETSTILSTSKVEENEKDNLNKTEDVEHLKKSISRVPIQMTFSSENLNSGKEKNLNNSDLAKNKQNNTIEELMHKKEFFEKPEYSDSDDISTYNSEMQSKLNENNPRRFQKQQDTSSTLSSDQLQIHLSKGLKTVIPDEFETGKNEYSDNSISSSVANLATHETKPSFNLNEKCNLVSNNLDTSIECTHEGYAKETRNNYLHEMSKNKMSSRQEDISESPDSYDKITESDYDPLCPSLEYECCNNFDTKGQKAINRNENAISLAKESFKSSNSLSSLNLPFTSEYINPKTGYLRDSFNNRSYYVSSQRNFSQSSTKLSCQSTANKKIELTKNVDKKSFVQDNKMGYENSLFSLNRYPTGTKIQDWPLDVIDNSIPQRSLNMGKIDMRNKLITKTDPSHVNGLNYQMLQGTSSAGQFGATHQNFPGRRISTRYPTIISLEDIQEVKSQDEKSSYTDARNNYNS